MVFYHIRFQTKIVNKQLDDTPTTLSIKRDYSRNQEGLFTLL